MWRTMLLINSVLLALAGVYFIYSLGSAILLWSWKQFVVALVAFVFLILSQIALAALAEP